MFLSIDPLAGLHPSESPNIYSRNNPLCVVDDLGLEGHMVNDGNGGQIYQFDEVTITALRYNSFRMGIDFSNEVASGYSYNPEMPGTRIPIANNPPIDMLTFTDHQLDLASKVIHMPR